MNPTDARAQDLMSSLGSMSSRTEQSEKAVRVGAVARLEAVNKRLEELRPLVLTQSSATDEYQGLIVERHRLNQVVMAPS